MRALFITTPSEREAKKIANALLKKRLVACCNIFPKVKSLYWWKNRIETAKECLLLCKTSLKNEKKAASLTKKLHSYEVPSIESFELKHLSPEYKKWLDKSLA